MKRTIPEGPFTSNSETFEEVHKQFLREVQRQISENPLPQALWEATIFFAARMNHSIW